MFGLWKKEHKEEIDSYTKVGLEGALKELVEKEEGEQTRSEGERRGS